MQKLGKNVDRYRGETIDIAAVLAEILQQAREQGWNIDSLSTDNGLAIPALRRTVPVPRACLYLSAGIHGDEPAGPLAVRQLFRENRWPDGVEICLCPCLNPSGFALNRRENADGLDLNRQYLHLQAAETRAHVVWLEQQPRFDVAMCLHEDWESLGFYLYELRLGSNPSHAEEIIRQVEAVCPIDRSDEIEGRPAVGGIVRPSLDPRSRPQWPEALWLISYKTQHTYTLEAPSDFPMETRVTALVTGVRVVLGALGRS
jgi:hypothetical protein